MCFWITSRHSVCSEGTGREQRVYLSWQVSSEAEHRWVEELAEFLRGTAVKGSGG